MIIHHMFYFNINDVMKKALLIVPTVAVALLLLLSALIAHDAVACTNLIAGKKATVDGSVLVSYNADSYGMFGNLYRHVGGTHAKGEMRKVYDWDTNRYWGEIPEAPETYNVLGNINEYQVAIAETTFGGREEMADSTGIIDYGSLMYLGLMLPGLVAGYLQEALGYTRFFWLVMICCIPSILATYLVYRKSK